MQQHPNFIVVGSGIAGLRAALELAAAGSVLVLTKDRLSESNTERAQGGVAVALSEEDEVSLHRDDTIKAGAGLCDEAAVTILVEEGRKYITELIDWGAQFDRIGDRLVFTREAAHSRSRVLHAHGDSTGREIVRALLARAHLEPNIKFISHASTWQLVVHDGRCAGVEYVDLRTLEVQQKTGRAVVLATGGAGQLYARTTNPEVATGDGVAMGFLAGAEVGDTEFFQFHPTALARKSAPRFLISEACRGEGGILINAEGERFMSRYDSREELAPRDVVSRSILAEMIRTRAECVQLDLRHLGAQFLRDRFPKIYQTCLHFGVDLTHEAIPVSPAAHYLMGGLRTDLDGRCSLRGLYAAGEVACTGVHGANRLASNSLLEGLVFGARAGKAAAQECDSVVRIASPVTHKVDRSSLSIDPEVLARVQNLMWDHAGIVRTKSGLESAVQRFRSLLQSPLNVPSRNFVTVASLVAQLALERTESRGAHYRSDFPERDDEHWQRHSALRREEERACLRQRSAL